MDPRVKTDGLAQQFELSRRVCEALERDTVALEAVRGLRSQLTKLREGLPAGGLRDSLDALDRSAAELDTPSETQGRRRGEGTNGFAQLNRDLATLLAILDGADATPTTQATGAVDERIKALEGSLARWKTLRETDLAALQTELRKEGRPTLTVSEK
ncbi:MAG TPA: hypothetical protein VN083_09295, partial [Vicinamibacteria bacterium]|nr:hypothetical protein [Vicinamibacteria bacterium]